MGSPKVPHCTSLHVSEQLLLKPNRQCFCPQLMQGKPPAVLTAIAKSFSLPRVLPCVSSTLSVAETPDLLTHFLMLGLPPGGGSEKSSHYWQCSVYIDNQYILVNANYFVCHLPYYFVNSPQYQLQSHLRNVPTSTVTEMTLLYYQAKMFYTGSTLQIGQLTINIFWVVSAQSKSYLDEGVLMKASPLLAWLLKSLLHAQNKVWSIPCWHSECTQNPCFLLDQHRQWLAEYGNTQSLRSLLKVSQGVLQARVMKSRLRVRRKTRHNS